MPNKRNTYGMDACTDYSLRVCGDEPCEYHQAIDDAKRRGITLQAFVEFRRAQDDEAQEEN